MSPGWCQIPHAHLVPMHCRVGSDGRWDVPVWLGDGLVVLYPKFP